MEPNADGVYRIMVYLDVLFDTRLGTMARINDDYAFKALCNVYAERVTDDTKTYCPELDFGLFKKAYAKRDVQTLENSHATTFAMALGAIMRSIETKFVCGSPFYSRFELIINEAPYVLTDLERATLRNSIVSFTKLKREIHFVNIPLNELSLEKIKTMGLNTVHLYEFDEWYSSAFNGKALVSTGANLVIPALFLDVDAMVKLKEVKQDMGDEPDPFNDMCILLAEWIMLDFTDPSIYSISPHFLIPPGPEGGNNDGDT